MAVGLIGQCDKCGETYDTGVTSHPICDSFKVHYNNAQKWLAEQGYGTKANVSIGIGDVIRLLMDYRREN